MVNFITNLINGLSLGSIYAIIAIGYTMVYGIAKMLNFAHGDVIMIGGYISFTVITTWGLGVPLGILAAVAGCMLLGMGIERVAYRPLRKAASPLAILITAIGVSYFLQNLALLVFGSNPVIYTSVVPFNNVDIGPFRIPGTTIVSIATSIVLVSLLQLFVNKTRNGQAMLACAQDRNAAALMGISINKTITLTFAIGSAMAGIAGVLLCSAYPSLIR